MPRSSACVEAALEVRQIHFAQGAFAQPHVHFQARILDAVGGVVFDASHDVALHAAHQRAAHLPHVHGILAVHVLAPAPARVVRRVDAYPAEEVAANSPDLLAHDIPDPFFQIAIKGRAPCHRDRKTGRTSRENSPWPISEKQFPTNVIAQFDILCLSSSSMTDSIPSAISGLTFLRSSSEY